MTRENNTTNSNFFRAFDEVYKIKKIKGITFNLTHKSVYCFLLNYQMMTGKVFPSYKHIQDNLGIGSDNTIKKYLDELEKMGLVKAISRKGTSNIYELVTLEAFDGLDTEEQQTRKQPNKNLHISPIETKPKEQEVKSINESQELDFLSSCGICSDDDFESYYQPPKSYQNPIHNKRDDVYSSSFGFDYNDPEIPF